MGLQPYSDPSESSGAQGDILLLNGHRLPLTGPIIMLVHTLS